MNAVPFKSQSPARSRIAVLVPNAYFQDAWSVTVAEPGLSAMGQFIKAFSSTPAWVAACMSLRDRVVSMFGLKDLGAFDRIDPSKPEHEYQPGDRVGIFTLVSHSFDEVVVCDKDKHLDVTLSTFREIQADTGAVIVTITTVVYVHNWLGRIYMLFVAPMHRMIAPSVLRAVAAKNA